MASNSTLVFSGIPKEKTMTLAAATYKAVKEYMAEKARKESDPNRKEESKND